MRIYQIVESTTSGSVASVAMPIGGVQKREGSLFKGKKTKKKFYEGKMKDLVYDLKSPPEGLSSQEFLKKYGKSKEEMKKSLAVSESELQEDEVNEADLILVPGQGKKIKPGFIPKDKDRTDHEVEMARSDLFHAAQNAKKVYELIQHVSEEEGLEGWVQEKIIKANDYLNTIREYLEHKTYMQEELMGGVIAGGQVQEEDQLDEKKDACYNKVKSRYKVWPSAYASGALVKCRKVGAANWGNKSKK